MTDIRSLPRDELRLLGNHGFALAMRMLRNREDAADAVQDAMHQMFRKQAAFDSGRGCLRAWFLKIVRNRCIDMQRKLRPRPAGAALDPADSGALTPDQLGERDELVTAVRRALAGLPGDAREIILLRDYDGLSYAEISQVLGIAAGTVMSRLHRARQQLRQKVMSDQTTA
jgi:RNA polymerase sigma-70 factor (ECF subfamily)